MLRNNNSSVGHDFVVPLTVKVVPAQMNLRHLHIWNFDPRRISPVIDFGMNSQPFPGCGSGNQTDDHFQTGEGLPRQFLLMKENRRCSILFHLLVPGGKWLTAIASPVSSASFCNSSFHSRTRDPLLPPPSAAISSCWACGYFSWPIAYHQRRMVSTANDAVSWSTPTPTHPLFCARS